MVLSAFVISPFRSCANTNQIEIPNMFCKLSSSSRIVFPYIGREHPEHALKHQGSRVGHSFQFTGLQISQLVSEQSQIHHRLWRLGGLQLSHQRVEILPNFFDEVLRDLNTDVEMKYDRIV